MACGPSTVSEKTKHRSIHILGGRKCTLKMPVLLYRGRLRWQVRKANQRQLRSSGINLDPNVQISSSPTFFSNIKMN